MKSLELNPDSINKLKSRRFPSCERGSFVCPFLSRTDVSRLAAGFSYCGLVSVKETNPPRMGLRAVQVGERGCSNNGSCHPSLVSPNCFTPIVKGKARSNSTAATMRGQVPTRKTSPLSWLASIYNPDPGRAYFAIKERVGSGALEIEGGATHGREKREALSSYKNMEVPPSSPSSSNRKEGVAYDLTGSLEEPFVSHQPSDVFDLNKTLHPLAGAAREILNKRLGRTVACVGCPGSQKVTRTQGPESELVPSHSRRQK